jgi:hypothetical protein
MFPLDPPIRSSPLRFDIMLSPTGDLITALSANSKLNPMKPAGTRATSLFTSTTTTVSPADAPCAPVCAIAAPKAIVAAVEQTASMRCVREIVVIESSLPCLKFCVRDDAKSLIADRVPADR